MSSVSNRPFLCLVALYAGLCIYLFRDVQITGDGAAYSLQALDGSPWLRSLHVGALAPMWTWVQWTGLPGGLLSVLWTALGLLASYQVGLHLLGNTPRDPRLPPQSTSPELLALLAPLSLMAATTTWDNALFVEVYAPLAALLLWAIRFAQCQHLWRASLAILWAGLVHPGAWLLVPGLLLFTDERSARSLRQLARHWLLPLCTAAAGHALILLALYPDWWDGGRGLSDLPPTDETLWTALQSLWRLLADDLGPAALPALLAAPLLSGRQLVAMIWLGLASALVLCRYSDNPGGLPLLWLLLSCSPLSLRGLDHVDSLRLRIGWSVLIVTLVCFGVGDATSDHDRHARAAEERDLAWVKSGCKGARRGAGADDSGAASWAEDQLRSLACRRALPPRP